MTITPDMWDKMHAEELAQAGGGYYPDCATCGAAVVFKENSNTVEGLLTLSPPRHLKCPR